MSDLCPESLDGSTLRWSAHRGVLDKKPQLLLEAATHPRPARWRKNLNPDPTCTLEHSAYTGTQAQRYRSLRPQHTDQRRKERVSFLRQPEKPRKCSVCQSAVCQLLALGCHLECRNIIKPPSRKHACLTHLRNLRCCYRITSMDPSSANICATSVLAILGWM